MTTRRVWAPIAERVDLETSDGRLPMKVGDDGWWEGAELAAGSSYRFVVDGRSLPDPRSARQPDGPDGWSEVVDHGQFQWTDREWTSFPLPSAMIYELHTGTFTAAGTFDGVASRLDELSDLGINTIEIMPVATFAGRRGWGYDGVDLFAPHEAYGGPDGLKRLIDAAHARRIGVIIDVVYNHLGPVGNHLHDFGPYFTDAYRSPWGDALNLDGPGSDEVRRFIFDNALQWIIDYHADGLRLDAVHALHDASAVHVLDELGQEVHAAGNRLGRTVWVIAESDLNDPRLVRSNEAYGYGLDASWSDDFHHALHVSLTGEQTGYYADFSGLDDLAEAISNVFVFGRKYAPSRERTHGQSVGEMERTRFVTFAQNHDQIGNRALGERLCHLVSPARAEIAAALLLTSPFVPMLFQGEEWAASSPFQFFTDVEDDDVAEAIREGRQAEFAAFGWEPSHVPDPQDPLTFQQSVLDWNEREIDGHARMLAWYHSLVELRATTPTLRDGRPIMTAVEHDAESGWLLMERGEISVVVNLGAQQAVPTRPIDHVLLTNTEHIDDCVVDTGPEQWSIRLPRDTVAIVVHPTT